MARPRTPTEVLAVKGAFKVHPERKKLREGEPTDLGPFGEAPKRFDEELAAIWVEVVDMIPPRVLAKSDRLAVEIICRLTRKVFRDEINGAELSTLNSLMGRMGMTPADRSKISVPKQAEELDEFAKIAAETTRATRPN